MQFAMLPADGTTDGPPLMQLQQSLVETLLCFQCHAQAHELTCSPISNGGHQFSPCPESPAMCSTESDLGCVSLAPASVIFPASRCLLWHRVNVAEHNFLMGWDLG